MSYTTQELNRKITFQSYAEAIDPATGYPTQAWTDVVSVFAKVEPLVGREYFAAEATQSQATTKFTMRFLDGLLPSMRIAFDGSFYDIQSIQNIRSQNRETLIYAKSST